MSSNLKTIIFGTLAVWSLLIVAMVSDCVTANIVCECKSQPDMSAAAIPADMSGKCLPCVNDAGTENCIPTLCEHGGENAGCCHVGSLLRRNNGYITSDDEVLVSTSNW